MSWSGRHWRTNRDWIAQSRAHYVPKEGVSLAMPATRRRRFGSVRKLPSARFQARYWHTDARHIAPETFAAYADALAWLSRAEAAITRGAWLEPTAGKATFEEVAARWTESNPLKRSS